MSTMHLVLIDLANLWRRCHGAAGLERCNALADQVMTRLHRTLAPTHWTAVLESATPTWRHQCFPSYKAERKPLPTEDRAVFETWRDSLPDKGLPLTGKEGYEADDVLASLARRAVAQGFRVTVVSTDKDLLQLLPEGVAVYHAFDRQWRDAAWVEAKYGISATQLQDWLALTGDGTDGIPGVTGVGPKTATALIQQYGSLEAVLAATDIPGKLGQTLQAQAEMARLSYTLVGLVDVGPVGSRLSAWRCMPEAA